MKVITGQDGKLETVNELPSEKVTKEDVNRTRRQLRDMLDGNTPFHRDDEAKKVEPPGLYLDSGEFVPARQINLYTGPALSPTEIIDAALNKLGGRNA